MNARHLGLTLGRTWCIALLGDTTGAREIPIDGELAFGSASGERSAEELLSLVPHGATWVEATDQVLLDSREGAGHVLPCWSSVVAPSGLDVTTWPQLVERATGGDALQTACLSAIRMLVARLEETTGCRAVPCDSVTVSVEQGVSRRVLEQVATSLRQLGAPTPTFVWSPMAAAGWALADSGHQSQLLHTGAAGVRLHDALLSLSLSDREIVGRVEAQASPDTWPSLSFAARAQRSGAVEAVGAALWGWWGTRVLRRVRDATPLEFSVHAGFGEADRPLQRLQGEDGEAETHEVWVGSMSLPRAAAGSVPLVLDARARGTPGPLRVWHRSVERSQAQRTWGKTYFWLVTRHRPSGAVAVRVAGHAAKGERHGSFQVLPRGGSPLQVRSSDVRPVRGFDIRTDVGSRELVLAAFRDKEVPVGAAWTTASEGEVALEVPGAWPVVPTSKGSWVARFVRFASKRQTMQAEFGRREARAARKTRIRRRRAGASLHEAEWSAADREPARVDWSVEPPSAPPKGTKDAPPIQSKLRGTFDLTASSYGLQVEAWDLFHGDRPSPLALGEAFGAAFAVHPCAAGAGMSTGVCVLSAPVSSTMTLRNTGDYLLQVRIVPAEGLRAWRSHLYLRPGDERTLALDQRRTLDPARAYRFRDSSVQLHARPIRNGEQVGPTATLGVTPQAPMKGLARVYPPAARPTWQLRSVPASCDWVVPVRVESGQGASVWLRARHTPDRVPVEVPPGPDVPDREADALVSTPAAALLVWFPDQPLLQMQGTLLLGREQDEGPPVEVDYPFQASIEGAFLLARDLEAPMQAGKRTPVELAWIQTLPAATTLLPDVSMHGALSWKPDAQWVERDAPDAKRPPRLDRFPGRDSTKVDAGLLRHAQLHLTLDGASGWEQGVHPGHLRLRDSQGVLWDEIPIRLVLRRYDPTVAVAVRSTTSGAKRLQLQLANPNPIAPLVVRRVEIEITYNLFGIPVARGPARLLDAFAGKSIPPGKAGTVLVDLSLSMRRFLRVPRGLLRKIRVRVRLVPEPQHSGEAGSPWKGTVGVSLVGDDRTGKVSWTTP